MGIQSVSLMNSATSLSVTGGTAVSYTPDGLQIVNGIHIADAAEADFRIRKNITFKNRLPQQMSDGLWSKEKRSITVAAPVLLASGLVVYQIGRLEFELHPEATAASKLNLRYLTCQMGFNASVEAFHTSGSLA